MIRVLVISRERKTRVEFYWNTTQVQFVQILCF